jgi:hypothetical protein
MERLRLLDRFFDRALCFATEGRPTSFVGICRRCLLTQHAVLGPLRLPRIFLILQGDLILTKAADALITIIIDRQLAASRTSRIMDVFRAVFWGNQGE